MRNLLLALAIAACGGHAGHVAGPTSGAPAAAFAATRWVPASPTYLVAAKTVRDGQRALHDVLDDLGLVGDFEVSDASHELGQLLGVDPLSSEAMANIGVDLAGGMAMFSEDFTPTFVVHLASPEAFQAFLDQQRTKGLATISRMVDGVELFTAKLGGDVAIAWAVDKDWLWVHFGAKGMTPEWFEHSHQAPGSVTAAWSAAWDWAQQHAGKAAVVGFARMHDFVGATMKRVSNGHTCLQQLEAIDKVGFAFDVDGTKAGAHLTFDLGTSAANLASHVLAPPPGWQAVAQNAPLQLQWNLDLDAVTTWLSPCAHAISSDPDPFADLKQYGVRTGRAIVLSVDPGDKSGAGAIALDLANGTFLESYVDKVSHFSSDKTFGPYRGHHVSIPFVAKLDYVFDEHVAIAAMGDGVMDRVTAGAPGAAPPVFSLSVMPDGMPKDTWVWLLDQAGVSNPKRLVDRFSAWREAHLTAALEGTSLVVEVAGNHK